MHAKDYRWLAEPLLDTLRRAGAAELQLLRGDLRIEMKADDSPVTAADRAAEDIILADLAAIAPHIPVVSEEAASRGEVPAIGRRFFLVDPLDGTKEFVRRSGEFTVNIALVEDGVPIFGMVFAPLLGRVYLTLAPHEAYAAMLAVEGGPTTLAALHLERLATRAPRAAGLDVVASKSHMNEATQRYLAQVAIIELRQVGSSLKFCLVAEAKADLYPRLGPTMEWDTAAGDAILRAAGGQVLCASGGALAYGKAAEGYVNPSFMAWGRAPLAPAGQAS
jgi:3'(2'), 5'-bisphosphate nucleotidase